MSTKKACPNCRGEDIYRSRRRTAVERYLLTAIGIRPYRCAKCDTRFYDFPHFHEDASPSVKAA